VNSLRVKIPQIVVKFKVGCLVRVMKDEVNVAWR
jgi:hypothetical protein